jgi:aspartyl-tRNA(Asn)/glutamyl-tRNA(Gln) amidotransferase subunit A
VIFSKYIRRWNKAYVSGGMELKMNEIRRLTALELGSMIKAKKISSAEATKIYLDGIKEEDDKIGVYISVFEEDAMKQAEEVQDIINAGGLKDKPLAGVPVAVKDVICVKDKRTTAGSKMLEGFRPPYSAHVIEKMTEAGAVVIGKTNLDEFAMGGSTETSYYGVTRNPWDLERVSGGSSGGSAAAVAAMLAAYSIGSDTGGSIRQPCSFCGVSGIKPTYGSVSRYGLLAYASSLDQIGPMGKDIRDCAAALSMISGKDFRDSTSIMEAPFDFSGILGGAEVMSVSVSGGQTPGCVPSIQTPGSVSGGRTPGYVPGIQTPGFAPGGGTSGRISPTEGKPLLGFKVALPSNYLTEGLSADVKEAILRAARELEGMGAYVEEIEIPLIEFAVPAYYIIACAEASSNLSRYDGVKYGFRSREAEDILDIFYKSRSEGFGTEVKRRIMLGSFVLSSGYFDAYYKKALQVRGLIKGAFDEVLEKYDFILSPVSPTVSYKIGENIADPLAMYMADIYTVSVNLAGLPAVALPCGFNRDNLPVGMQFIGRAFSEPLLVQAGIAWQEATDYHKQRAY